MALINLRPAIAAATTNHSLRIAVLPDVQAKPGTPTDHLRAYGMYIARKQPDVVVCLGDFADMPSLSAHDDPAALDMQNQSYANDIGAAHKSMDAFMNPILQARGYDPELYFVLGNHEIRIDRTANNFARFKGCFSLDHLKYEEWGWKVSPFLEPITVGGVMFNHFFPTGVMGRAASSASAILRKYHQSCFAGHQQGRDIAYSSYADGRQITTIISGSFYQHDEKYLPKITNNSHWRGAYFLHEVKDGSFDEMALSLDFFKRKFT